jgi:hypothetical protein
MAVSSDIAEFLRKDLGAPVGTSHLHMGHLRKAKILPSSKSGFGAATFQSQNGVDVLLSMLLAPSNSKAVATVQRVRGLEMRLAVFEGASRGDTLRDQGRNVFEYLRGLGIGPLNSFGNVLTTVVDALRSDAFTKWAAGIVVDFHDGGTFAQLYILPTKHRRGIVLSFGQDEKSPPVSRILRIDERILRSLAETLGPLETLTPPQA